MFSSGADILTDYRGSIIMVNEILTLVIKRMCLLISMQDFPLRAGKTELEICFHFHVKIRKK